MGDFPALRAQAAPRGSILGSISREQMALTMKAADYVALHSGYEGCRIRCWKAYAPERR
jgi:hypothetical protein